MRKTKKCNANLRHQGSYNTARNHALQAIFDDIEVTVDGQTFSYDKQQQILTISDFTGKEKYKVKFNGMFCDPYYERISDND